MFKANGACKITGVAVGEFQVELLGPSPVVSAKYALCNVDEGTRVGAGHRNVWSEETVRRLTALVESMEKDIAKEIFSDTTTSSGGAVVGSPIDEIPGL